MPEILVGISLTEPSGQLDHLDGKSVIPTPVSSSSLALVLHQSSENVAVVRVGRGTERVALWQSASDSGQMITS